MTNIYDTAYRKCSVVLNGLSQKINTLSNNRFSSPQDYHKFLKYSCDIGRVDIPYSYNKKDKGLKILDDFISIEPDIKRIINISDIDNISLLQRAFINKESDFESILGEFGFFLKSLNPSTATTLDNMVLNFYLLKKIDEDNLPKDPGLFIDLYNYFISAVNVNPTRRSVCFLLIIEHCINNEIVGFFKLRKQFYNHVNNIFYQLIRCEILTSSDKKMFMHYFLEVLRTYNSFYISKKKSFAVCISGKYRNHLESLKSIKEKIVDPLNADVFIHTWDQYSKWSGLGGAPHGYRTFGKAVGETIPVEHMGLKSLEGLFPKAYKILNNNIEAEDLSKNVFDILSPKEVSIESEKSFTDSLGRDISGYTKARGSLNQIKMLYGIKKSFDMALRYGHYDFIIRCRPDSIIRTKVSDKVIDSLENNVIYTSTHPITSLNDGFFCLSSPMALSFSNFVNLSLEMKRLCPLDEFPLYDAHNFMMAWMVANNYLYDNEIAKADLMPNQLIALGGLKEALRDDFNALNKDQQMKFKYFVESLTKRNG